MREVELKFLSVCRSPVGSPLPEPDRLRARRCGGKHLRAQSEASLSRCGAAGAMALRGDWTRRGVRVPLSMYRRDGAGRWRHGPVAMLRRVGPDCSRCEMRSARAADSRSLPRVSAFILKHSSDFGQGFPSAARLYILPSFHVFPFAQQLSADEVLSCDISTGN